MKNLSNKEIEGIANRVLKAYWRLDEAQADPFRVNPEILLTILLKLVIDYRKLSNDGLTLGMTAYDVETICLPGNVEYRFNGKTVLIESAFKDEGSNVGRRNFTIAHEGAHHIFKMLFPDDYGSGAKARQVIVCRTTNANLPEERQMDTLASFLLMPEDLIHKNLVEAGIPCGIGVLEKRNRYEYRGFLEMCKRMGVSKQALSMRMEKARLIEKNRLWQPFTPDIF